MPSVSSVEQFIAISESKSKFHFDYAEWSKKLEQSDKNGTPCPYPLAKSSKFANFEDFEDFAIAYFPLLQHISINKNRLDCIQADFILIIKNQSLYPLLCH